MCWLLRGAVRLLVTPEYGKVLTRLRTSNQLQDGTGHEEDLSGR